MSKLTVNKLCKEFPTPTEPLRVLSEVDLAMNVGENLAIIGPSGCGKSTLLHIIGTLDSPTSGSVHLDEADPFSFPPKKLAAFRNQKIGFVFQEHYLLPQLSAIENVLVPCLAHGRTTSEQVERATQLLTNAGLGDRVNHRPSEMSGGERQRVAVARALVLNPVLVLADEPTGNLDQNTAEQIGGLLIEMQKSESAMLICVTHSNELANRFDQINRLDHGRLVEVSNSATTSQEN